MTDTANNFANALSTIEASTRFQVSANYVTQLARKGAIKAKKLGRDWIIDEVSLETYLRNPQRRGPKLQTKDPHLPKSSNQNHPADTINDAPKRNRKKEQTVP